MKLCRLLLVLAAVGSRYLPAEGFSGPRRHILQLGASSAWLLSLAPTLSFENALPEVTKFSERRTPGKQPDDLGLKERTLNRFGDKSDGAVLKGCGYGPNCFSTTGDPEDPQITTLLQPWKIPAGSSVADASAQLEAVLRNYPPGQQNVDGGGFQILKAGPDGYVYAQFESLKKGKIDDLEFAVGKDGSVQARSSGRIGLKADFGSNAKRLNYIAEKLQAQGWTAPSITKDTHPYYFSMNSGKTKVQCIGIDCPVNYELIAEEPGPSDD
ncbi:unnamed protein product [Effrenium voratum]|uniref:Uncharacterized protein n=1 Tax=Effrenium voratum TaxID=2562239 RepID=A0AA36NCC2_9DINO|nr:unnamed protein product [Effrenium voratum]CAJ1461423.1 unnamed protein product [Effrenium voratum]